MGNYNKWTDEELNYLREHLHDPVSLIKKEMPTRHIRSIYTQLAKLGRDPSKVKISCVSRLSKDVHKFQVARALELLKTEVNWTKISEITGLSSGTVRNIALKAGYSCPSMSEVSKYSRKLFPNYTEKVRDLNFEAYIIGVIATDGSLTKNKPSISWEFSLKDIQWLEDFSKLLVEEAPRLHITHNRKSVRFMPTLPNLYKKCTNLGMTPNKTKTLNLNISGWSVEEILHFLRGVIDGDGSIYNAIKPAGSSIRIFTASPFFKNLLQEIVPSSKANIQPRSLKATTDLFCVGWGGSFAQALALVLPKKPYMLKRKSVQLELLSKIDSKNKVITSAEAFLKLGLKYK